MKKWIGAVAVMALLVSSQAQAGFINITPGQWATFNAADSNCAKTTKSNSAGLPVVDVVTCTPGEEFQISTVVPQNANTTTGVGWDVEFQWKCADGDTCVNGEIACMQSSHIICDSDAATPEDCEALAFVNVPTNPTHFDVATANIGKLVSDTTASFLTTAALESGVAVPCTTTNCDGEPINFRFELTTGTVGDCVASLTGDIDIVRIVVTYPED